MYSSFLPSQRPSSGQLGIDTTWHPIGPDRTELAGQFFANPWGPHGPELQYLLNRMRTGPTAGKLALLVIEPYSKWQLIRLPRKRGEPVEPLEGHVYTSLAAAECAAFSIRWQEMFGVSLSPPPAAPESRP